MSKKSQPLSLIEPLRLLTYLSTWVYSALLLSFNDYWWNWEYSIINIPAQNYTCVTHPSNRTVILLKQSKKVKWSHYRPGVVQRVGRGIALLFHECSTIRGWVVSSTPRQHFTPRIDMVPIVQEAGWAPGPVWTGGKSRPNRDSIPDLPAHSQSLYRLNYPVHTQAEYHS